MEIISRLICAALPPQAPDLTLARTLKVLGAFGYVTSVIYG